MGTRAAKFASAMVASVLAGASLSAPREPANAAECLTQPGTDAPKGQHWRYHIERETKRHCWYLRGETDKAALAAPSDDSASTATSNSAARAAEPPPRPVEDAHAEFPASLPRLSEAPVTPSAMAPSAPAASEPSSNRPQAQEQGSAVASRWPTPSGVSSQRAQPAPTESAAPETSVQTISAPAGAAAPAVPPEAAAERPSASLQMLLAVIAGALALAGVIASVLFRLGRARRAQIGARRRRAIWESVDDQTAPSVIPPWVEPGTEQSAPVRADTLSSSRAQSSAAQERYQKIEEILAELVKQAQLDSEAVSSDRHVSS